MAQRKKSKTIPLPSAAHPEVAFVNEKGEECVATLWDGKVVVFKIHNPNDPIWKECREALADIPPLNWDEAISEGREELYDEINETKKRFHGKKQASRAMVCE